MRGDIHGPAASAKFPYTSLAANRKKQRTYFGRDETVGPKWIKAIDPLNPPTLETGFTQTLFDPTKAPEPNPANANYNPVISDVTASVRTAVFYCIEDNFGNNTLGKMLWRYPTKRVQTGTTTVDDLSGAPYYSATNLGQPGGWQVNSNTLDQVYGSDYNTINASSANASQVATFQAPLPNAAPNATYSVFAWIPAPLDNNIHLANRAQYTVYTDQGPVQFSYNQDQAIALGRDPNDPLNTLHRTGGWRRIASNIHFPAGVFNGSNVSALGKITVQPDSTGGDDNVDMAMHISDRIVVSDAIQFVAESSQSNSVVAAPLITNVTWPSGILRQMVYFATTDGHVWALDAEGQGNDTALTQAYWVYPSISDPDPAHLDLLGTGNFDSVDDPNVNPDTANNVVAQGIDGDVVKTTVPDPAHPGSTISTYTVANAAPALDSFVSSPMLIQVRTGTVGMYTYKPYIVVGNQNGRIYALDPVGRTTALGEPFPLVFASGDTPGIPGTTRRNMTWPTIARDKWLRKGGLASGKMTAYTDDPAKSYFNASIAANVADGDFTFTADRLFAPAGDGHIYCVDLQTFKSKERISNPDLANAKNDGAPKWQYPSTKTKLDAMTYPGAFNAATKRYVFTAGGRIYAVDDFNTTANGVAKLAFVYPGTSAPPANPLPTDKAALQSNFTGPILMKGTPLNGGNLVAYATTQDGKVYAFDATVSGGAEPPVIFTGTPIASTRSNPVYLKNMLPSAAYVSTYGPHILFGTDAGALLAFHAGTGVMDWAFYDGFIGGVPIQITDSKNAAQTVPVNTSNVYRTADIATANGWLFQGTEGIQETGEMGGQMRAYADKATYGGATDGEPPFNPDLRAVETRLVDLFNAQADDPTNRSILTFGLLKLA